MALCSFVVCSRLSLRTRSRPIWTSSAVERTSRSCHCSDQKIWTWLPEVQPEFVHCRFESVSIKSRSISQQKGACIVVKQTLNPLGPKLVSWLHISGGYFSKRGLDSRCYPGCREVWPRLFNNYYYRLKRHSCVWQLCRILEEFLTSTPDTAKML